MLVAFGEDADLHLQDNLPTVAIEQDRVHARVKAKRVLGLVKAFLKAGVLTELGEQKDTPTGVPLGRLCSAEHNPPNAQRWIMRSVGLWGPVRVGPEIERCA